MFYVWIVIIYPEILSKIYAGVSRCFRAVDFRISLDGFFYEFRGIYVCVFMRSDIVLNVMKINFRFFLNEVTF